MRNRYGFLQGTSPAEELKAMKIFYLGEDFYNEKGPVGPKVFPRIPFTSWDHPIENTEGGG